MIRRSWTQAASIEETLALWAASLRDVKKLIRPLFTQERVATNAGLFLEGLLGDEPRKTGWMRAEAAGDPGPWRQQAAETALPSLFSLLTPRTSRSGAYPAAPAQRPKNSFHLQVAKHLARCLEHHHPPRRPTLDGIPVAPGAGKAHSPALATGQQWRRGDSTIASGGGLTRSRGASRNRTIAVAIETQALCRCC